MTTGRPPQPNLSQFSTHTVHFCDKFGLVVARQPNMSQFSTHAVRFCDMFGWGVG